MLCFCLSGVGWNGRVQTECCASASAGSVGTGEYRRSAVLLPQWGRLERESADRVLCFCLSGVWLERESADSAVLLPPRGLLERESADRVLCFCWNGRVLTECCASASVGSVGMGKYRFASFCLIFGAIFSFSVPELPQCHGSAVSVQII